MIILPQVVRQFHTQLDAHGVYPEFRILFRQMYYVKYLLAIVFIISSIKSSDGL